MEKERKIRHRPYLYHIGDTFETRHGTMTVIGTSRIQRSDKIYRKQYTLQCEKGHQYNVKEEYLTAGRLRTCKKCNHPTIIESDPAFAAWFVDPSIPRSKSCGCHDKADFYCPSCGKVVRDKSISNIYKRQRVPCPYCANGVSYPERYMIALLEQMQVSFVHQHTVKLKGNGKSTHYKYDFYDRERQLVIEVHGEQHFTPGTFERVGGQSLEQIRETDAEKERYAIQILGLRYISLDCRKSEPGWIRQEVTKKLGCYPLANVDWEDVRQKANKSVILQLIELSKQGYTQKQIGEIVHMSPSTVCQKLQKAIQDGLYDGITPRLLRAEENKRLLLERREHSRKEKEKREALRKAVDELHAEQQRTRDARQQQQIDKICSLGTGLTALDPYQNGHTHLRFRCACCHQVFRRTPASLLVDDSCPYCKRLAKIKYKVQEKYGDEYEILSSFSDSRTPLQIRHKVCGGIFSKTASNFLKSGCPACGKRRRTEKTSATRRLRGKGQFFSLLPDIEQRGYTFIGESFQGLGAKNAFLCSHCGEIWWTTAHSILSGRNHICISPCKKKTHTEYVEQVYRLVGDEYSVLTEYRNAFAPIKMRHNPCGFEYLVSPAHFTSTGRRCPMCSQSASPGSANPEQMEQRIARAQKLHTEWELSLQSSDGQLSHYLDYVWNRKLEDAQDFYIQHGHLDIPYGYLVNGYNLGGWLADQRKFHNQGRLPPDRVRALNALGIKWKYKEENWHRIYEDVKEHLSQYGPIRLRPDSTDKVRTYYHWINGQIKLYRKGRLSPDRISLLQEIGITLDYKSSVNFEIMYEKLRRFVDSHGHCIVPLSEGVGEDNPLGPWAQRMRMRMAANDLPTDQTARLATLGLPTNNKTAKFQQKLALLASYRQASGHLQIPQSYTENGHPLGKWINSFRTSYAKGRLPPEQVTALEAIDMVW